MTKNYTINSSLFGGSFAVAMLLSGAVAFAQVGNPSDCGLNLAIPDAGCGSNNSLVVPITVSGYNNELGVNAQLISVEFIISHPWRDDLHVYLTPPDGTEQALMVERGSGSSNYGNPTDCPTSTVMLEDGAAALNTMGAGNNITGTWAPEVPLSQFTGNPNGTWTLRICDNFGDDVGALQYVALGIINEIVGIEERTALEAMELWPNPTSDQLNIGLNSTVAGQLQYQLFDAVGRQVMTGIDQVTTGGQTFTLDMNTLPSGQYSIRFILNGTVHVQRFMKS